MMVVRDRALAGAIVLCIWARHFTLTVLSTQDYVPKNMFEQLLFIMVNALTYTKLFHRHVT